MGHEKLNVEMARTYGARLSVIKIPKSGGVVELDLGYRERVHRYQLHTYMYGQVIEAPPGVGTATLGGETMSDLVLSPSSIVLGFDDLAIYRIGEGLLLLDLSFTHLFICLLRNYGPNVRSSYWRHADSHGNAAYQDRSGTEWLRPSQCCPRAPGAIQPR